MTALTLKAWQDFSRRLRDTVYRSFVKCGIALPTSGQRDSEINLSGLENSNYTIGHAQSRAANEKCTVQADHCLSIVYP